MCLCGCGSACLLESDSACCNPQGYQYILCHFIGMCNFIFWSRLHNLIALHSFTSFFLFLVSTVSFLAHFTSISPLTPPPPSFVSFFFHPLNCRPRPLFISGKRKWLPTFPAIKKKVSCVLCFVQADRKPRSFKKRNPSLAYKISLRALLTLHKDILSCNMNEYDRVLYACTAHSINKKKNAKEGFDSYSAQYRAALDAKI